MNVYNNAYLGNYLKSFKTALNINDLTVQELHDIMRFNGIKPVENNNLYSRSDLYGLLHNTPALGKSASLVYQNRKDKKRSQIQQQEIQPQLQRTPEQEFYTQQGGGTTNYYTDEEMRKASNELLAKDEVFFDDDRDDELYESMFSKKVYFTKEQIEFIKESKKKVVKNDEGEIVPDKCPECGSEIGVYIQGEPIYRCTNNKCKKYFGTMPCTLNESYFETYNIVDKLISNGYLVHGTNAEFTEFDQNFIKGGSRAKEGYGFYFGDLPYKPSEYGNQLFYIKKDDFNFLPLTTIITKDSPLYNDLFSKGEELNKEIYKLKDELDNVRNIREYDRINDQLTSINDELFEYNKTHKNIKDIIDATLYRYDVKNVGQLEYNIPSNYIIPLSKLFIELGYDGYYHDHVYTVFNFDKLNQLVHKYDGKESLNESLINGFPDDLEYTIPELESFGKKMVKDGDKVEIFYSFGKNGMGLTCELDEIGKDIQTLANDYFLYLDNEPHFDTCDDIYDLKVVGHKKTDEDKKNLESQEGYILKRIDEMKKHMNGKKIYLTEQQVEYIKEGLNHVDPNKVLIIKKYLDDNFTRGKMPIVGDDGYPKFFELVGMKGPDGNVIRNMTSKQLYYLLQDKFKNIFYNKDQRNKFIKQIIKDWYYRKISNEGLLSKNNY